MTERRILWTVTDPRRLSVSLAEDVWEGILIKHAELGSDPDRVRRAVQDPDEIYFDPSSTAQRTVGTKVYHYIKRGTGSISILRSLVTVVKVVIEASEIGHGYVSTAFLFSHLKKGLTLEWKQ